MFSETQLIMGLPITIASPDPAIEPLFESAFAIFTDIDKRFSTYKSDSEISRFNTGQLNNDQLGADTQAVLARCQAAKVATSGFFNIERGGSIDPSGLVKGWSIKLVADHLRGSGLVDFYIDAGGDIAVGGVNQQSQPWLVGIRHPRELDKIAKTVRVTNAAVATSGQYERADHVYNPHTGKPAADWLSLTVIGPDIETADVLATAAFAMGRAGLEFIEAQPDYEAFGITPELQGLSTSGFNRYA